MNKSKEEAGNSKQQTAEKESKNPTTRISIHTHLLAAIMSTLTKWVVIASIISFSFGLGTCYNDLFVNKDERNQQLKKSIKGLEAQNNRLSDERDVLKQQLQDLKKKINRMTQDYNLLERNLQNSQNEINKLKTQNSTLEEKIESALSAPTEPPTPSDTTLYDVTLVFTGFSFLTSGPRFKIYLDQTLRGETEEDKYTLSAAEAVYDLKIKYKDSAGRTWQYKDEIIFNESSSQITIKKTDFQ